MLLTIPDFLRKGVAVSQKLNFDSVSSEAQNEQSFQGKEQVNGECWLIHCIVSEYFGGE